MAVASTRVGLANAQARPYQADIARACYGRSSLIVLPTGLGKTITCALVMARHLEAGERVLVLAPTRPLVDQHAATFREQLPDADVQIVTGSTSPEDRGELWKGADVAVATPQTTRNDLLAERLDPSAWGLLVVDEAHKSVGNYAAVPVAEELRAAGALVLGATASPGSTPARIEEVCQTLGIEHIEARGCWDEDVAPYVQNVSLEWVRVSLPRTLERAAESLRRVAEQRVDKLRSMGLYASRFVNRGQLLKLRSQLQDRLDGATRAKASDAMGHVAAALRVLHGVKLIETQSTAAARAYLNELATDAPALAEAKGLRDARRLLEGYMGEHPKMRRCASELRRHLENAPDGRAIIFVQTRQTARVLQEALDARAGLDVGLFVGQSGDDGLSQDEQLDLLDRFQAGDVNVLVATSVAEEGLDIPSVDLVVFYEAVASAVRTIQRRGRTGRAGQGRVVVLMARGTSDEAAYWSATKRERRMRELIEQLQRGPERDPEPIIRPNPSAKQAGTDGPRVLVDHRELNGPMARLLRQEGISLEPTNVPVGDLVLSSRVVVERKTVEDFVRSIIDGRLMDQARALSRSYTSPIIVIEGDPLDHRTRMNDAAITGAIATLPASFGVSVLTAKDAKAAARLVASIAKREHTERQGPPAVRNDTPGASLEERQRFLVEGLPRISATLGERLLEHFGTPAALFSATQEELSEVEGIGTVKARDIHEVLHAAFETPWRSAA